MAIDERFDSDKGEVEKKLTDAQTRADEKAIVKILAKRGYNALAHAAVGCYNTAGETAKAAPKALFVDLPVGLIKTAAATAFQAIPMLPSHRHRILEYFCGKEKCDNRYAFAGNILQFPAEIAVAITAFYCASVNHSDALGYLSMVLGADILSKIMVSSPIASHLPDADDCLLNGWGQGVVLFAGGFLYMAGSTAKDLFDFVKGEYKQKVHYVASQLKSSENEQ
ncbi:hypothetical protein KY325_04250 [Candidatus Woesearchaeota archaeon]|nr:hypothetical protein [Candidatus Woesearchaeota archaeon]